jgi:hypothetical protein
LANGSIADTPSASPTDCPPWRDKPRENCSKTATYGMNFVLRWHGVVVVNAVPTDGLSYCNSVQDQHGELTLLSEVARTVVET